MGVDDDLTGSEARSGSVVSTAMAVLRCFRSGQRELGVVEIAERTGLHKSSVSRLMNTLEAEDLVERDPSSRKYRLGLGLLSVAGSLLADLDVRRAAYPVLADLAERTQESCSLMVWDKDQAVCVEQVPSEQSIKHTTPIGTTFRTTANSSVKAFLASQAPDSVRDLVGTGAVPLQGHPSQDALLEDLERVRTRGSAVNDGGTDPGEVGVSALVRDHRGAPIAAVLLSAPRFRVDAARLGDLEEACLDAAAKISTGLGGGASPQHVG